MTLEALLELLTFDAASAYGNGWYNVALFLGALFLTFTVGKAIQVVFDSRLRKWAEASETELDDALVDALDQPVYLLAVAIGLRASFHMLILPEAMLTAVDHVWTVVMTVFVAWTLTRVGDAIKVTFVDPWVDATETKLDDQIVPILDKTFKFAIWSLALLMGISNLGYDIFSLLTGLGIGGLAVAMAAQHTLSNVIGSVTIFADQPFQVDDLISVANHKGVVREVGIRTLRIEAFDGNLVTIPNAIVVAEPVVNHSPGEAWRHSATIGLVYETNGEQLRAAMQAIRDILTEHPQVRDDFGVRFVNFGDSALEIAFAFWVETPTTGVFLNTISEVNLAIKDRFDENGWNMAFPSMSVYLSKD